MLNKKMFPFENVMIVDDEPAVCEILSRFFTGMGCLVKTASDGKEALTLFKENPMEVVITDYKMPLMDGRQLAGELKKIKPDCRVILLTAFGSGLNPDEEKKNGIDSIISKPVPFERMIDLLSNAQGGELS